VEDTTAAAICSAFRKGTGFLRDVRWLRFRDFTNLRLKIGAHCFCLNSGVAVSRPERIEFGSHFLTLD
jgi:hypothetical protein